ncbi:hypothetical protein LB503_012536 [Fusarium chuoi]|nr:hypothetical protein LB503_012536 [Fusarium chuoi]
MQSLLQSLLSQPDQDQAATSCDTLAAGVDRIRQAISGNTSRALTAPQVDQPPDIVFGFLAKATPEDCRHTSMQDTLLYPSFIFTNSADSTMLFGTTLNLRTFCGQASSSQSSQLVPSYLMTGKAGASLRHLFPCQPDVLYRDSTAPQLNSQLKPWLCIFMRNVSFKRTATPISPSFMR